MEIYVYLKFYTDTGEYTTTSGDPTSVMFVYPYRKVLSEMAEHEWLRTDFISSWEGDAAIVNNISDLWGYTGAMDSVTDPDWAVISGSPMVSASATSLKEALDYINDGFGDRVFTEENYITSGQSISDSLNALDVAINTLAANTEAGVGDKYIVTVASDVDAGVAYQLPVGVTYTPDSTSGQQGSNMDIYLDGQLLFASTGVAGVNEDKDYAETSPTHVTFHYKIHKYSNLTFVVRQ